MVSTSTYSTALCPLYSNTCMQKLNVYLCVIFVVEANPTNHEDINSMRHLDFTCFSYFEHQKPTPLVNNHTELEGMGLGGGGGTP